MTDELPDLDDRSLDPATLEARINAGELTNEQAAELLQQAARREAALGESMPDDPDDRVTESGFGSGQGMEKQQTGQGPSR